MSVLNKITRAILNKAIVLHRKSVLATVRKHADISYKAFEVLVRHNADVLQMQKKGRELQEKQEELAKAANAISVVANYELGKLPAKVG